MVVAITIAAGSKAPVVAGVSPLAELLSDLHVLAEPDHHPEARAWTEQCRRRLGEGLRAELYRFAPLWARYRLRLLYPLTHELDRTLADELDALRSVSDDVFLPLCANAILGRSTMFASAADVLGAPSWVRECEHRSFNRGDLAHLLTMDPGRFRDDLLAVLAEAGLFFDKEWRKVKPVLEASARTVRQQLVTEEPARVLASLSGMASLRRSSDTVYFDKLQTAHTMVGEHGLILVPSLRGWPHVMIKTDAGLPVIVQYLVREHSLKRSAQSQADLRQRLIVLAEPGRWELCRHLIGESITTSELAMRTGTTKPAVSRHLRIMREAGLVVSQKEGRQVFHRLHSSVIEHLGQDILRAILR